MPRHPDPQVDENIRAAARKLWIKGGEKALSMRAIARIAHTNTPAIYRRFRNRKAILRDLVEESQQDLFQVLEPCESLQEVARRSLDFALSRPHEYELLSSSLLATLKPPRSNFEFIKRRAAEWFGGAPEDHAGLVLATWSLVHGAALLLISKTVPPGNDVRLRIALDTAMEVLVRQQSAFLQQK